MDEYLKPSDIKRTPILLSLAKKEGEAFLAFHKAAGRSDGVVPQKYRELIALGVAFTTQCPYCIDTHTGHAIEAGATREEIAEAAFVAASVRAGGTLSHTFLALRLYDEKKKALESATGGHGEGI